MDFNAIITNYGPAGLIVPAVAYILYLLVLSVTKANSNSLASFNAIVTLTSNQTAELNKASHAVIELERERSVWIAEKGTLLSRIQILEDKVKELAMDAGKYDYVKKELENIQRELFDLKAEVIREKALRSGIEQERDALRLRISEMQSKIDVMEKEIQTLRSKDERSSD